MQIRQVVVTGQNQVALQDLELDGGALGTDEVLIKTEYTFISAGTELANYTGREPQVFQPGRWCSFPWKSGYANVGIVRAVGAQVDRVAPGARVFTYGPHASAFRYTQRRLLIHVPSDIPPHIAAASRMAGVSATAIIVSEFNPNDWVVVYGLGAVGNLAAQFYQLSGCRVIGVDRVAARCALAERCGIATTVCGDAASVREPIMDLTGGRGVAIAVDAVGDSGVLCAALAATATHGQLVLLGTPRVAVEGDLTRVFSDVHLRWITLRGALEWCIPMYSDRDDRVSQYSKQEMIWDWIQRGVLQIAPLISHHLAPDQIAQAYEGLLRQREIYTGVALDWSR